MNDKELEAQDAAAWEDLNELVREHLLKFGIEDVARTGDFWIDDDDWGKRQLKVYFRSLHMLHPQVISSLQHVVKTKFSGWEIVVAVSVPGSGDEWPSMGLFIREHEIVDGLERQYFPKEAQDIQYPGSRRGSVV